MPGGIPIFLHRCGLTRELFDLIVELRPSSTSGGLAEQVKRKCRLHSQARFGLQCCARAPPTGVPPPDARVLGPNGPNVEETQDGGLVLWCRSQRPSNVLEVR